MRITLCAVFLPIYQSFLASFADLIFLGYADILLEGSEWDSRLPTFYRLLKLE